MKQEVLINNLVGILYQGLFLIRKATYIDKESGRDKRFAEIPVRIPSKQNKIYLYFMKEKKKIIILIKMMMMMFRALNIRGTQRQFSGKYLFGKRFEI